MQIRFQSLANFTVGFFQDQVLPTFTAQQKRIILIASLALGCLAAILLYRRYCFTEKKVEPFDKEEKKAPESHKKEIDTVDQSVKQKIEEIREESKKSSDEPKAVPPTSPATKKQVDRLVQSFNKKIEELRDNQIKPPLEKKIIEEAKKLSDQSKDASSTPPSPKKKVDPVVDPSPKGVADKVEEPEPDPLDIPESERPFVARKRPDLFDKFVPPADFKPQEIECAKSVIGRWMHTQYPAGYAFSCPGMQVYLTELESRKKVMNYLLKEGFFEAWGFGYSGIPLVKTFLTDKCPPMKADNTPEKGNGFQYTMTPTSWRTRKTLENEEKFIKKNWIASPQITDDEIKQEFPDENQRDLFFKIVKDLNTRVNDRPHPIVNHGDERPILEFLLKKKLISRFEEEKATEVFYIDRWLIYPLPII